LKGRLVFQTGEVKMIQGVREIFEILDSPNQVEVSVPQQGKIVLIGRHVNDVGFGSSFAASLG
jgi:hypothetical protein